jgi:putative membrane protein
MPSEERPDSGVAPQQPAEPNPSTAESRSPLAANPDREALGQQPRWLHPTSFIFDALSHIRSFVVPFLLALFGAAQDELFWQYFGLFILILSLVHTGLHYLTLRYRIVGGDLVINSGLIFRRVRTIPIRKIQNLDLIQNPLHRLFRVAEVRVETASGAEADAVLRVLSLNDVDQLRGALFPEQLTGIDQTAPESAVLLDSSAPRESGVPARSEQFGSAAASPVEQLLRVPLRWLALAGLSSDRGLLLVGVAIGALFQFNDRWFQNRAVWRLLSQYANTWAAILVGLVIGWVLLKLLSIGWFTLRFFDYRLTRVGDDLRISSGLITRVSATIPRRRIQFISVHRPLLFRWTGFSMIKLETAGGSAKDGEGGTTTATRSWFVPVVPDSEVPRLLSELRPDLEWRESEQTWQPVSPRAAARLIRIGIATAALLTVAAGFMYQPWGALAGFAFFPLLILWAIKKGRSHSYARTPFGVAYRSGLLTRKLSLTFYERIQSVSFKQSPFDRRWKMAVLSVDTAAAGPAEHVIEIPLLQADFARDEFSALRELIARNGLAREHVAREHVARVRTPQGQVTEGQSAGEPASGEGASSSPPTS